MISKEEIKRLADLARIEVGDKEAENLAGEIDAILGYVGQVKSVVDSDPLFNVKRDGEISVSQINVMREDQNPNEPGTYNKELIGQFPESENDYLKVKKIL